MFFVIVAVIQNIKSSKIYKVQAQLNQVSASKGKL
jgi:hypothetical protein